ncbi:MAG: NAD(P)-dependent oxidoreductase, partial [Thermoguttaceae bacterium]
MAAKIYYDKDANLALLKNKTIAILGYGSQGHAHAQNLRDSGCTVIVAELPGTPNGDLAVKDGFTPITATEATKKADVLTLLLPDELQGEIFRTQIREHLTPGKVIVCSHGFNVHYGQFDVPKDVSIILVAPKGPGHLLRAEFVRGAGVPCLIAVGEGSAKEAF